MSYRAIALDLDGTALDSQDQLRSATIAAVEQAQAQAIPTILVTGRHHLAALPFHRQLALKTPIICCNGAYIYDPATQAFLAGEPLPKTTAREFLNLFQQAQFHTLLYTDQAMFYEKINPHINKLLAWQSQLEPDLPRPLIQTADFNTVIDQAHMLWKFVVSHPDPEQLQALAARLTAQNNCNVEQSWHDRLDIGPKQGTKGSRLAQWAKSQNIPMAQVIAFGDNYNDLSMIEAAGLGIAMANAPEAVRAKAKKTIASNNSDAIAETLRQLLL